MTQSASKRVGRRPLGLIYIFSPDSVRREVTLGPSWAAFEPWSPDFRSGGSSPQAPRGSVGVGRISCITLSSIFTTRGAELTILASMARVSRSVSSLMGTFERIWVCHPLTGSIEPSCGIRLLLNPPPGRCLSRSIGSGGPLASPRWSFCGLGSRLESNEKGRD